MKLIAVLVLSHHSKANIEEEFIIMCRSNTSQFCYGKLLCLNTLRSKATPSLQLLKKNVNAFHDRNYSNTKFYITKASNSYFIFGP